MREGTTGSCVIQEIRERDIRPLLQRMVQVIRRDLPNESYRILLFGSWATLEAAPTSDIDIAILGITPIDSAVMSKIHADVDELPTLRKIQVIDGLQVQERFRDRILNQGQMLALRNDPKP